MIKIKNWNFSIILTIIFIVFGIFLYTLFDPVKSTELLSTLHRNAAVIFESTFQYGTLVLIAFLIIFALSPKGLKVISITGRDKYSYISWGFMIFTAGMGASILY
jgi:choline-glycine betaine transporter